MENFNCNIINDLLPLYLDNLCSEESKQMIEEHLKSCKECQKTLNYMKNDFTITEDTDARIIKKVKQRIRIEKFAIAFAVFFVLLNVLIIGGSYVIANQTTMNDMLQESDIRIEEDNNGDVWLIRSGNAIYASHTIGEIYTEDGKLVMSMNGSEVSDYTGNRVVNLVLYENTLTKATQKILGDTSSIEEERNLLFNTNEKTDRTKITITLSDEEIVLWEKTEKEH